MPFHGTGTWEHPERCASQNKEQEALPPGARSPEDRRTVRRASGITIVTRGQSEGREAQDPRPLHATGKGTQGTLPARRVGRFPLPTREPGPVLQETPLCSPLRPSVGHPSIQADRESGSSPETGCRPPRLRASVRRHLCS